jgi:hypothetical protein
MKDASRICSGCKQSRGGVKRAHEHDERTKMHQRDAGKESSRTLLDLYGVNNRHDRMKDTVLGSFVVLNTFHSFAQSTPSMQSLHRSVCETPCTVKIRDAVPLMQVSPFI